MQGVLKEFKGFLMRGNLIELAVAFVIGIAFAGVVASLVDDLITPLIGAIIGKSDFSGLSFTINSSHFMYGSFLTSVLSFVSVAAAVFFFVVKPMNMLLGRVAAPAASPTVRDCPECLSEIPKAATRCSHCTAQVGAAS